ncbi:MAG: carbon storage regulator CsrA [Maioricimonas sp. JB049]
MLVLSRKENESIQIGENVVVKVVSIGNGRVRLAIDAPREISIVRGELVEAIRNQAAGPLNNPVDAQPSAVRAVVS